MYDSISVIVCTRDRGSEVAKTVASVLNNSYPDYELLLVDQSRENQLEESLKAFRNNPRFHYYRCQSFGLSAGRNFGAAKALGDLIAFTDDDCEAPPKWLECIAQAFQSDSRIRLIFGSVLAAPHDSVLGIIPSYEVKSPFIARGVRDKIRIDGMGACMALRRSLWIQLSGFDPCLGAGSPLHSAEENDFALRTLIAGHWIYETPSVCILHRGFRRRTEIDALISGYLYGSGAMYAKHLRLRKKGLLLLLTRIFGRWLFGRPLVQYCDSHKRMQRLAAFFKGWIQGMKMPIDRRTGHFVIR